MASAPAVHDPVIPPAYFLTWPDQDATRNAGLGKNLSPRPSGRRPGRAITGPLYILVAPGSVPKGTRLVARFKVPLARSLYLYRVPGAAQFTFGANTEAKIVSARQTGNASWRLNVDVPTTSALTLHLSTSPGGT